MNKFKLFLSVIAMMLLGSTAIMAQESKGYALFGAVPEGYEDLTGNVVVPAEVVADGVITLTNTSHSSHICQDASKSLQIKVGTEALNMALTNQFAIHIKMKKATGVSNDVHLSFCKNGWNDQRIGFRIKTNSLPEDSFEEAIVTFDNKATNDGQYYCHNENNLIGNQTWNANGEIFRIAAASGETLYISQIYIEKTYTPAPVVIPDQAPQRIYLNKGTAITPTGVAETADYSDVALLVCEGGGIAMNSSFAGITNANWWFNFQLKSSTDVDLTPVYSTWNLVFRVKNGVVEEGQDRGLTVQVNDVNMNTVTTYADANNFVTYVLPLKTVLFGTNNLGSIATGQKIIDFSTGNNNEAGRAIEFDYIYLTNETEPIPANVSASANATAWNKVELRLFAECATSTKVTYDVTYNGTTKTFTGNAGAITTCVIDGLEGSTAYTFSVVAKNSAGEAAPVTANATTPAEPEVIGYAIFGEVPTGYMDLTSHVSVNGYGTYSDKVSVEEGKIKFTGNTSLSNSRVCADEGNNIRLQFTSAQALTLTSNLAIYIKVKKGSANSESNLHFALCKDSWNSNRIGYFIPQAKISNTAEKEIILKYADRATSDWSSAGSVTGNNVTFGAGDIVRLQAQTDDYFEITQIYIEKTYTPELAPTNVTATATAAEWDKVTLNLKADCEKSTVVTYEVTYGSTTKTFTGNVGELTTCVIEGLEGSTEYTFSVVAKNEDGVAADAVTTTPVTTPAKPVGMETRYYFFSSRETLPAGEKLLSVDLRDGKGTTIAWNNAMKGVDPAITTYSAIAVSNGWFSFNQNLKAATDMSAIADGGYLVIKMRSNLDVTKKLNVRLCNNVSYVLDADDVASFDNNWHVLTFDLKDAQNHPVFNNAMNGTIFQLHSDGMGEGKIDIDYAYLTNDATNVDEGTALEPEGPPTNVDVEVVTEDYYSVTLKLYAECERSTIVTYDITVKTGETIVKTVSCTGNPSEWTNFTVADIPASTEYTFSVVAKNQEGFGAEAETVTAATKTMTQDALGTRYYLVGEGDASNPNHIAVACNTEYSNSTCYQDERILDYYSIKANTTWMAVNFKPVETKPNTINNVDAENWHIVMRMRSSMDNNIFGWDRFRVNLVNNGQNFYLNTSDWFGVTSLGDGQWHTVKFKLSAATGTVPSQFLQKDQIAVQLHVNDQLQKDEFFDIDYLYFTNEVVEDNGTQDGYKILLRDTKDNTALLTTYNAQTVDVDLNRSFVADGAWYTLCLPFSMTADQVNAAFGACKLAKLNGSELRGSSLIHLNFDYVNTIEAGVPYLFMPMADVKPVIIEDVKIDNTLRPIETTYFNMNGIFSPTQVATGDYFLGSDNYLYPVQESDNSSLKGLRAYFTIGAGAPASAQARVVMAPTVTTDLQENTITTTAEKVIKDGTIYILRGDKIYTTTGQLVK